MANEQITINNVPRTAYNYKYIIYRLSNEKRYYYGADNDLTRCSIIAATLGNSARITESEKVAG